MGRRGVLAVLAVAVVCIGLVLLAGYGPVPRLAPFRPAQVLVQAWQHALFGGKPAPVPDGPAPGAVVPVPQPGIPAPPKPAVVVTAITAWQRARR